MAVSSRRALFGVCGVLCTLPFIWACSLMAMQRLKLQRDIESLQDLLGAPTVTQFMPNYTVEAAFILQDIRQQSYMLSDDSITHLGTWEIQHISRPDNGGFEPKQSAFGALPELKVDYIRWVAMKPDLFSLLLMSLVTNTLSVALLGKSWEM